MWLENRTDHSHDAARSPSGIAAPIWVSACRKLATWFEERWEDHWCIDISKELLEITSAAMSLS